AGGAVQVDEQQYPGVWGKRGGQGVIPDVTQKLAEPLCNVLRGDATVDGLQEVQLFGQFVRLLILLRHVVLGLAVVVHWISSFPGCGVVAVDLTSCWAARRP